MKEYQNERYKNEATHFLGLHHGKEKGGKSIRCTHFRSKQTSTPKNKARHSERYGLEINAMFF